MRPDPVYSSKIPARKRGGCFSFLFWSMLLCLGLAALILTQTSYFSEAVIKEALGKIQNKYQELRSSFITNETQTSAQSVVFEIGKTHGDEVAVASPTLIQEEFNKSDTRMVAWGTLNMGTNVTEIKVATSYRFHVKISELQQVSLKNGVLKILVPKIHPTLPVAYDSQKIEKKSTEGWLRFDGQDQLQALERNITPALAERASEKIDLIKETARGDLHSFVQKWVNAQGRSDIQEIQIYFEGEDVKLPPPAKPDTLP